MNTKNYRCLYRLQCNILCQFVILTKKSKPNSMDTDRARPANHREKEGIGQEKFFFSFLFLVNV